MSRGQRGSRSRGDPVRSRSRRARFLIWVLALLVILLLLSLIFGGFQKGTKVGLGSGQGQRLQPAAQQIALAR
jgi:hypothetical protein